VRSVNLAGTFFIRPTVLDPDSIAANRSCDHIFMAHEMEVVLVPCIKQIAQGQLIVSVKGMINALGHKACS
jgi:hypothetical protein